VIINGIEYEQIKHEPRERKGSGSLSRLMAIASMMIPFSQMDYGGNNYSRSLPSNIDIVKEFELIQQKKSILSRWERDQVVRIFNQNFKIKTNEI
jgi:hypothetical protein